jgi:hypothetical protein
MIKAASAIQCEAVEISRSLIEERRIEASHSGQPRMRLRPFSARLCAVPHRRQKARTRWLVAAARLSASGQRKEWNTDHFRGEVANPEQAIGFLISMGHSRKAQAVTELSAEVARLRAGMSDEWRVRAEAAENAIEEIKEEWMERCEKAEAEVARLQRQFDEMTEVAKKAIAERNEARAALAKGGGG